jgi:hypothetical protein
MSPHAVSRLVLVGPTRTDREEKIRRYRLARVKLNGPDRPATDPRYEHLKRVYD